MKLKAYKCISDSEVSCGFYKSKIYLFDPTYGLMYNHKGESYYYWDPNSEKFKPLPSFVTFAMQIYLFIINILHV